MKDLSGIKMIKKETYSLPPIARNTGVNIFIVGGGGTASMLLPNLLRLVKFNTVIPKITVTVIDGDTIEEKNLTRQNFHPKYLNKNKAKALAECWGNFVGVPVAYIDRFLEDADDMKKVFFPEKDRSFPIIVGCVDSMQCRAEINNVVKAANATPCLWIDSGNEEFFGQTIVSANYNKKMPTFVDIAPELFAPENLIKTSDISCAESSVENIQNIGANIQAANNLFVVLNQLLSGGEIDYRMLTFDVRTMNNKKVLIEE